MGNTHSDWLEERRKEWNRKIAKQKKIKKEQDRKLKKEYDIDYQKYREELEEDLPRLRRMYGEYLNALIKIGADISDLPKPEDTSPCFFDPLLFDLCISKVESNLTREDRRSLHYIKCHIRPRRQEPKNPIPFVHIER